MNRENKRKQYEKGYYKTHPCNETFICKNCGRSVIPEGAGSDHRNHCPNCLYSLHVDIEPGDRASDCGGHMEPVSVWVRNKGEWAIIHRCKMCGAFSSNRVAADDNPMKLMSIAMKPIGHPPFPLERIEEMTRLMGGQGSLKQLKCRRGIGHLVGWCLYYHELFGLNTSIIPKNAGNIQIDKTELKCSINQNGHNYFQNSYVRFSLKM